MEKNVPTWAWIVMGILAVIAIILFISDIDTNSISLEDYKSCVDWCLIEHHECQFTNLSNVVNIVNCSSNLNMCEVECGLNPHSKKVELLKQYLKE